MEDFLGELMTNEFDTVVEDGSLPQVSILWTNSHFPACSLSSPCLFLGQDLGSNHSFLESCARTFCDSLLPKGKSLVFPGLSKLCLFFFISLHTTFSTGSILHLHPKGRSGPVLVNIFPIKPCWDCLPFYLFCLSKRVLVPSFARKLSFHTLGSYLGPSVVNRFLIPDS